MATLTYTYTHPHRFPFAECAVVNLRVDNSSFHSIWAKMVVLLTEGFFQGYTHWVVAVIVLQALGGLIVAAIIKYADNILKSFAAAMSIVGSTIISAWVFDFSVSKLFAWGCSLQFISIYLYARKTEGVNKKQMLAQTSEIAMMRGSSGDENDAEVIEILEKKGRSLF